MSKRRQRTLVALGGLILLGLVALFYAYQNAAHVRGHFVSYQPDQTQLRINVLGRRVIIEDGIKPSLDVFNAYILTTISAVALLTFVLLRVIARGAERRLEWFFGLAWLGALYLAADELIGIHETLGYNMQFLHDWFPFAHEADNLIFASYIVPSGLFLWFFRDVLLSSLLARRLFLAGIGIFGVAALFDLADLGGEEAIEPIASSLLAAAFVVLAVERVAHALGRTVPWRSSLATPDEAERAPVLAGG